ncbi:MAG: HEAT repeat domain-containing protein [Planctomycetes bacterium]|nr:HEAT repeat domain-containing protein [Planctomycetota bacterium]
MTPLPMLQRLLIPWLAVSALLPTPARVFAAPAATVSPVGVPGAALMAGPQEGGERQEEARGERRASGVFDKLVERDRKVGYTSRTAGAALAALSESDLPSPQRAAAFFALGAARAETERSRLESWALEGSMPERQAALLALGELGGRDIAFLERVARSKEQELAIYAVLALLRTKSERGREIVDELAEVTGTPVAAAALACTRFVGSPDDSKSHPVVQRWLELRWESARRFGLIDGQTWSTKIVEGLLADERFLDRVVYAAAANVKDGVVRDHYLEIVLEPGPAERLRGAISVLPTEIDKLVATGLWAPADEVEWTELLEEIDAQRLESLTANILRQARVVASLRTYASLLLVRGGNSEGMQLLELEINSTDPLVRARIAEVLGGTGDKSYLPRLLPMMNDADAGVRNASLVAQLRLGHGQARDKARERLLDADDPEHEHLMRYLCRNARDPEVKALLVAAFRMLTSGDQVLAATYLSLTGRSTEREVLRDILAATPPSGEIGARMVRAIGVVPTPEDATLLRTLFPREGELDVNVALVLGLIEASDPACVPVLRAALWREPYGRSLLAAAVWVQIDGLEGLVAELQRPPLEATPRDLRRVGFALGEWGGLDAAEELARRNGAADPAVQGALLAALASRTR